MLGLSLTGVFKLWILGAVDFKQEMAMCKVRKIPLVAVWEPREGMGLDLGLGP